MRRSSGERPACRNPFREVEGWDPRSRHSSDTSSTVLDCFPEYSCTNILTDFQDVLNDYLRSVRLIFLILETSVRPSLYNSKSRIRVKGVDLLPLLLSPTLLTYPITQILVRIPSGGKSDEPERRDIGFRVGVPIHPSLDRTLCVNSGGRESRGGS